METTKIQNSKFLDIFYRITYEDKLRVLKKINTLSDLALFQTQIFVYLKHFKASFERRYPIARTRNPLIWFDEKDIIKQISANPTADNKDREWWLIMISNALMFLEIIGEKSQEMSFNTFDYYLEEMRALLLKYKCDVLESVDCLEEA